MSDNYLVYKDQLHPNVKEMLSEDIGDVENLTTESKTVVGALNELIGKDIIAEKFGGPLSFTDSWSDMGNKIETVENKLRANLIGKDVDVNGVEDINGLVDKVNDIELGPEIPESLKINGFDCVLGYLIRLSKENVNTISFYQNRLFIDICNGTTNLNKMVEFNLVTGEMIERSTKTTYCRFGNSTNFNGDIYINGGKSGTSPSFKKYDITTYSYTSLKEPVRVYKTSSVVNDGKDIYVIGGYSGEYLKTVQKYDILTNTWTNMTDCPLNVEHDHCVYVDGYIYALPQHSKYDINSNTWSDIAAYGYSTNTSYLRTSLIDRTPILIDERQNKVFYYDIVKNTWASKQFYYCADQIFEYCRDYGKFIFTKFTNGIDSTVMEIHQFISY